MFSSKAAIVAIIYKILTIKRIDNYKSWLQRVHLQIWCAKWIIFKLKDNNRYYLRKEILLTLPYYGKNRQNDHRTFMINYDLEGASLWYKFLRWDVQPKKPRKFGNHFIYLGKMCIKCNKICIPSYLGYQLNHFSSIRAHFICRVWWEFAFGLKESPKMKFQ